MFGQSEQVAERSVWILTNGRLGDLKQMKVLAGHLGWTTEIKQIFLRRRMKLNIEALAPLFLDRSRSDRLTSPWPAIVVTAATPLTPIARWIRRRSAYRTKLIHIGRPAGDPRHFSLVVTSPEFLVQEAGNIIRLPLPLTDAGLTEPTCSDHDVIRELGMFPRPRTAVLVGGRSPPYPFGESDAQELSCRVLGLVRHCGGSLLITTSPRTGKSTESALFADVGDVPFFFYKWSDGTRNQNPYKAILHMADQFVVTCDSVSMIADAIATGKPTYVHDLCEYPRLQDILPPWLSRFRSHTRPWRFVNPVNWLFSLGILRIRTDRRELLRRLRLEGLIREWPAVQAASRNECAQRYWGALRELTGPER